MSPCSPGCFEKHQCRSVLTLSLLTHSVSSLSLLTLSVLTSPPSAAPQSRALHRLCALLLHASHAACTQAHLWLLVAGRLQTHNLRLGRHGLQIVVGNQLLASSSRPMHHWPRSRCAAAASWAIVGQLYSDARRCKAIKTTHFDTSSEPPPQSPTPVLIIRFLCPTLARAKVGLVACCSSSGWRRAPAMQALTEVAVVISIWLGDFRGALCSGTFFWMKEGDPF